MKKILLLGATAVLAMTSCTETWDGNPVLKTHEGCPTVQILNEPVMKDQEILLTAENATGTFHMTCSQPDYGYAAVTTYWVQVSLTEDFTRYEEVAQAFYDCSEINPLNSDIAAAIEYLNDVKTEADLPIAVAPIYVRLYCYVEQDKDNTQYFSNVVKYKGVGIGGKYLAIWPSGLPTDFYLRGDMNGWGTEPEYLFYTGVQKDTWIVKNVTILKGQNFKVGDAGWGASGYNYGVDGDVSEADVTKGKKIPLSYNSGNISCPVDFTGDIIFGLSSGNYYLQFDQAKDE